MHFRTRRSRVGRGGIDRGTGLEGLEQRAMLTLPWASAPAPLAGVVGSTVAADFDLDGKIDLAVSSVRTLSFLKGNGDATFQAARGITLLADIGNLAVGRFDGDGRPDLITLGTNGWDLWRQTAAGFIRTPDRLGWDLHYATETPTDDGGKDIVIATDRPIRFWEAANLTRTLRYPFTVIEIHLDKDGKGEGRMSVATKVSLSKDGKTLELENYSTQPVILEKVAEQR